MTKVPIYQVHRPGGAGEAALLAANGLSREGAAQVLQLYARQNEITIGTILGVGIDGILFTPTSNWQPDKSITPIDVVIVSWDQARRLLTSLT
jgi:hypothetical protein